MTHHVHNATNDRIKKLALTVNNMGTGAGRIAAIAKLALAAMETPEAYRDPENFAHALRTIAGIADGIENCITTKPRPSVGLVQGASRRQQTIGIAKRHVSSAECSLLFPHWSTKSSVGLLHNPLD